MEGNGVAPAAAEDFMASFRNKAEQGGKPRGYGNGRRAIVTGDGFISRYCMRL